MDFYLGLAQVIGIHTLLGLSAWCVLHTGQVSIAQGAFFAIGAYVAGMLTSMWAIPLALALAVFNSRRHGVPHFNEQRARQQRVRSIGIARDVEQRRAHDEPLPLEHRIVGVEQLSALPH